MFSVLRPKQGWKLTSRSALGDVQKGAGPRSTPAVADECSQDPGIRQAVQRAGPCPCAPALSGGSPKPVVEGRCRDLCFIRRCPGLESCPVSECSGSHTPRGQNSASCRKALLTRTRSRS